MTSLNFALLRCRPKSNFMASGQLVFIGSESWRTAYERVLRTPGLSRYLSVAGYAQRTTGATHQGRRSIRINYDLAELGLQIQRIVILNDFFWAPPPCCQRNPSWLGSKTSTSTRSTSGSFASPKLRMKPAFWAILASMATGPSVTWIWMTSAGPFALRSISAPRAFDSRRSVGDV